MAKEWYVEVSKPAYPEKGRKVRVFKTWNRDALSPTLTHLFRVKDAQNKEDALAKVMAGDCFTMICPNGGQLAFSPSLESCLNYMRG